MNTRKWLQELLPEVAEWQIDEIEDDMETNMNLIQALAERNEKLEKEIKELKENVSVRIRNPETG